MTAELFLIGDSHAIALAQGAKKAGVQVRGGPLGTGKQLQSPFWRVTPTGDFVLTSPHMAPLVAEFRDLLRCNLPILSTVGMNAHRFAADLAAHARAQGLTKPHLSLSQAAFVETVRDARSTALDFYRCLVAAERQVYVLHSPQRVPRDQYEALRAFETALLSDIQALGVTLVDIRPEILAEDSTIRSEFARLEDAMHASPAYGRLAVLRCLDMVAHGPSGVHAS